MTFYPFIEVKGLLHNLVREKDNIAGIMYDSEREIN